MRILCLAFLLSLSFALSAQSPRLYQSPRGADMLDSNGDTLLNAWTGGLLQPQFSNIDLNNDGRLDLFVFEIQDSKVLTFVHDGGSHFRYAPEYEQLFPKMEYWALLYDYNYDGRPDIFTYSREGGAMDIYKNVSSGNNIKFKLEKIAVDYHEPTYDLNLYVSAADIPALGDVDGDGDMDVLAYEVSGTIVYYYQNNSMELYGIPDSLDFSVVDYCWGKFRESATDNSISLGQKCMAVQKKKHGGSTMLMFDAGGDGDMDLLLGDISYDNLILMENGRKRTGFPDWDKDSMINAVYDYPAAHPAGVVTYPAAFMVDANGDSIRDLLVSPQGRQESISKDHIQFFKNTGTNANPQFSFVQDNFLAAATFGRGIHAAPAFWDYNNDGLTDMTVAVQGNEDKGYHYDKLVLYKNIGSSSKAVFQIVKNDFAQVMQREEAYLAPTFGDLNGDGKTDMLVGSESGRILHYTNKGLLSGIPQMELVTDNYAGIQESPNIKPFIHDIDKDGLPDLVTGNLEGAFSYYHNNGTSTNPQHQLVSSFWGKVRVNEYYYQYVYDSNGQPIDSFLKMYYYGNSSPIISDLDHNGKMDLISGSAQGKLFYFPDIEDSLTGTFTTANKIVYNKLTHLDTDKDLGAMTAPAAALLDDDIYPDLLIGNFRGGMYYLGSRETPIYTLIKEGSRAEIAVYPNPALGSFTFFAKDFEGAASLNLYDIAGRSVLYREYADVTLQNDVDISKLRAGIYIIQLKSTDRSATARLVIQ